MKEHCYVMILVASVSEDAGYNVTFPQIHNH